MKFSVIIYFTSFFLTFDKINIQMNQYENLNKFDLYLILRIIDEKRNMMYKIGRKNAIYILTNIWKMITDIISQKYNY